MNDSFEKKLLALSTETFESQLKVIDSDVLKRLSEARHNATSIALNSSIALKQAQQKLPSKGNTKTIQFPSWLSPVSTATAFASILLVSASLWLQPGIQTELNILPLEDISMLTASDEFELYENLDFYIWLEDENSAG